MSPAQITILLNYIPLEKTASEACTVYVTFIPKDFAIKIKMLAYRLNSRR